jgi:hypothetical protein
VHSYSFAAADVQLTDATQCNVAPALCRKDCSVYYKTEYVLGEASHHYFLHHLPSWLREGQYTVVKGFISVFYTPNDVEWCPLCCEPCSESYFGHLLSPCPNLGDIFTCEAG